MNDTKKILYNFDFPDWCDEETVASIIEAISEFEKTTDKDENKNGLDS
jgi:hypothetical protein